MVPKTALRQAFLLVTGFTSVYADTVISDEVHSTLSHNTVDSFSPPNTAISPSSTAVSHSNTAVASFNKTEIFEHLSTSLCIWKYSRVEDTTWSEGSPGFADLEPCHDDYLNKANLNGLKVIAQNGLDAKDPEVVTVTETKTLFKTVIAPSQQTPGSEDPERQVNNRPNDAIGGQQDPENGVVSGDSQSQKERHTSEQGSVHRQGRISESEHPNQRSQSGDRSAQSQSDRKTNDESRHGGPTSDTRGQTESGRLRQQELKGSQHRVSNEYFTHSSSSIDSHSEQYHHESNNDRHLEEAQTEAGVFRNVSSQTASFFTSGRNSSSSMRISTLSASSTPSNTASARNITSFLTSTVSSSNTTSFHPALSSKAKALSVAPTQTSIPYSLLHSYEGKTFFDGFDFYSGHDPTNGHVQYVDKATALKDGLIEANADHAILRPDSKNIAPRGRKSVRVETKAAYHFGSLTLLDLEHMPYGCGTWPAFWTLGDLAVKPWPHGGEFDIIEGVNQDQENLMVLHTAQSCPQDLARNQTGTALTRYCQVDGPGQFYNQGCSVKSKSTSTYGEGLNSQKGGVFAFQLDEDRARMWFFDRDNIPADIQAQTPDPEKWGVPAALFEDDGCDFSRQIVPQKLIINLTFCGDWAGNAYSASGCPSNCVDYVTNNPEYYADKYWDIRSLRVYVRDLRSVPAD